MVFLRIANPHLSDDNGARFWHTKSVMNENGCGSGQAKKNIKLPTRVLIADDRPRSRDGLKALLAIWSEVEVVGEATNGQEAVRLVEKCRPEVVLMDAIMPVMDGLEATGVIKDRWPEVKVIVLTIHASYRDDALAAGAEAFLIKGCPAADLLRAILDQ
jgi:YesN/AraC family two-component response regulator